MPQSGPLRPICVGQHARTWQAAASDRQSTEPHDRYLLSPTCLPSLASAGAGVKFGSVVEASGGLIVRYQPEGSLGICELEVRASVPPFAGAARGYFNDDNLRAFVTAISVYPLGDGPVLNSGPVLVTRKRSD